MAQLPAPGNKARWFLAIVIIGGLLAAGFTYYNRLKSEESDLLASIAQSNKTIESFRAVDLTPLKNEIADAQARSDSAGSREASLSRQYRTYSHSIEIQERLYRLALESGCTINSLRCSGPTAEESGGIKFESYAVVVDAESAVPPSLLNFLFKVSEAYPSGVVSSVDMSIPRPPTEGTPETRSTVSFDLRVVYLPQEAA